MVEATYMEIKTVVGPHPKANFLGLALELVKLARNNSFFDISDEEICLMLDLAKPNLKKEAV